MDPSSFINGVRRVAIKVKVKLTAQVVDHIPENVPFSKSIFKKSQLEKKGPVLPPEQVLFLTHNEILIELQSKHTGLLQLSRKCDHKLFKEIARTVFERLKHIMDSNMEYAKAPFVLSKAYRKSYPHFGDFQLILSTLHSIEDAAGSPRSQISEQELSKPPADLNDDQFTNENVKKTVQKYITRIEQKILEYVNGLKTEIEPQVASPEELAQNRVRVQFKKIVPYMNPILRQVMTQHFHGGRKPLTPNHQVRMKIYGEPFLPTRDHIGPIMDKCQAVKIIRSDYICNMVAFSTRYRHYLNLMALNGQAFGGARIFVRPARMEKMKMPPQLVKELEQKLKCNYEIPQDQDMEEWDE
ncbi:unnamed protein product [Chilo suppressalis]|uniref:RRM domain-containing protein n=1 Tax=Chilo suppressalis TaxID=168631 RepID=A0ABN8L549_CHISP|nr:unnamed protein product [Chilo suppressalis]